MISNAIRNLPNGAVSFGPEASRYMSGPEEQSIFHEFNLSKERIRVELNRLMRSGNVNLIIGGGTTLAAVLALSYIVFANQIITTKPSEILAQYIPRLSVVILMETFSFFFLRMYRANMLDIKYFQNELTNIEFRFVSMRAAFLDKDRDLVKSLALNFASTERNFLLKKGESTVEIEIGKFQDQSDQSFIDGIKWMAQTTLGLVKQPETERSASPIRKRKTATTGTNGK